MDEAEGEESCPLCLELLDVTDRSLQPCKCHYRVCLWCLNHIRERLNGLCPACRTPYEEVNFTVSEVSKETAVREAKERANAKKERERREKQKEREKELARAAQVSQQKALTNLKHARFVVRNLVYVIGLSMSYAREEYIRRSEMFGRFGRIIRVLVNRAHPYNSDAPGGPSISAYIQFARDIDASAAVRQMSNVVLDGREIRCHIACTKYCDAFVRSGLHCGNADCMYVHEQATNPEEVLSREDVLSRQLGPPPPAHLFLPVRRRIDMNTPSSRAAAAAAAAATAQAAANAQAAAAAAAASAAAASGNYSTAPPALSSNPTLTSASAPTLPMQRQYPAAPPNGSGTSGHRSQGSSVSVAPSVSVPGSQSHQHRFPPFISQTPASSASSSASGVGRPAQRSPPLSPRFGAATTQAGIGQSRGAQPVPQVSSSVGWGASPPLSTTPQRSPSQSPPQRSGRRGQAPPSPPGEDLKRTRKRPAGPAAPSGATGARPGASRSIGGSIGRSTSQSALSSTSTGSQPSVPPGGAPPGFEDVPAPATALSRPPPGFGAPRSVSNAPPMPSSSSGPAIGRSGRGPPGFDVSSSVAPPTVPPVTGPPPSSGSFDWPWSHDPARSGGAGGRVTAQSRGGPAGAPVGGTGDRLPDRPQAQEPSTFRGGHGSIERAEAAFSGRGIVLPAMSIPTSFSGVRSSGGTGPAALPHEALSVANGVHSLPHGQGGAGGVAEMLTQRGFGMDAPGAHAAFVAPELRPSRRSNSRFGFAREEEQPVPPASSLGSAATSSVSSSSAGTSSRHVPPDPPSVLSGTSSSKTAKSRFDFAEHELSPPRTSAPPGLAPAAPPQIFPFAADVGGMSSPADGVAVSFSQLSTQDKLASLFQSAKWSSEALPPMPSAGDGLDRSQNHGTSPFSQQHQGGPRDRVANNSLPAAATAAKPSNSPLVPPGFREATSEQPQQVDRAPTSVSPGVAASLKDEEGRKVEAAMTVRLKGSSPGSSEVGTARRGHSASESDISSRPASTSDSLSSAKDEGCKVSTVSTREGESVGSTGGMPQTHSTSGADIVADANAVDLVSEFELERQVEAARAREARLAAQLSDLQQRIRHFDART